jgi:transposase-like protein
MSKSRRTSAASTAVPATASEPAQQRAKKAERRDLEVLPKPQRRTFTAEYKARILAEADGCEKGALGALLRREGLYSSHLATWRRQRERGAVAGLTPKKRGRKRNQNQAQEDEIKRLRRQVERLQDQLHKAQVVIDVQKKVAMLLGVPVETPESEES